MSRAFWHGMWKHQGPAGLGVARCGRRRLHALAHKGSDQIATPTHEWHDDGERWLGVGWPKDCVLPTNMTIQYNGGEERRSCIASGEPARSWHVQRSRSPSQKGSLFASIGSLRVQSRRTRVIGEGVSAHVNVMDGFVASSSSFSAWRRPPTGFSRKCISFLADGAASVVVVSESQEVPFTSAHHGKDQGIGTGWNSPAGCLALELTRNQDVSDSIFGGRSDAARSSPSFYTQEARR